tara:strand:+ start:1071 stop:1766 length:696 start_codon:yes stop_codon:yes gene_type:complete
MAGESFTNFQVFLELQRRNEIGTGQANRIPLFCSEIGVTTSKTVMNMGVPFSGAVRGESLNLGFDIGMSQKQINLQGMILGQTITKQKSGTSAITRKLTAYEMAQLIHSYADSSSFQDDQNLSKIVVKIPSRVNHEFEYHTTGSGGTVNCETADESELPTIPFTWKNREYDNDFTALVSGGKTYFDPSQDGIGITGFIRNFNTTLSADQFPAINFTLDFEEAMVISDNFLD